MKKNAMMMTLMTAALLLISCGNAASSAADTTAATTTGSAASTAAAGTTTETEKTTTGTTTAERKQSTAESTTESKNQSADSTLSEHIYYLLDDFTAKIADGVEFGWQHIVKCDISQKIEHAYGDSGQKVDYYLVTDAPFTDEQGVKDFIGRYLTGEALQQVSDEIFDPVAPTYLTENGKLYVNGTKANKGAIYDEIRWDTMELTNVTENSLTAKVDEKIYDSIQKLSFDCVKTGTGYDSWRISKIN